MTVDRRRASSIHLHPWAFPDKAHSTRDHDPLSTPCVAPFSYPLPPLRTLPSPRPAPSALPDVFSERKEPCAPPSIAVISHVFRLAIANAVRHDCVLLVCPLGCVLITISANVFLSDESWEQVGSLGRDSTLVATAGRPSRSHPCLPSQLPRLT